MPTGMVSIGVAFVMMNGKKKLFQVAMKVTIVRAQVMLQLRGR